MNEPIDPGKTEFVLPIICPHCKKELELSMAFDLLPPKDAEEKQKNNDSTEEATIK